jgi:hypothetical protein
LAATSTISKILLMLSRQSSTVMRAKLLLLKYFQRQDFPGTATVAGTIGRLEARSQRLIPKSY